MENIKRTLLITIICLIPFICYAVKMTDFTEDTSPTSDDLIWTTNNPSGTPSDRKVSLGNLLLWMATQDNTFSGAVDLSGATLTLPSSITTAGETTSWTMTLPATAPTIDGALRITGTDGTEAWLASVNGCTVSGTTDGVITCKDQDTFWASLESSVFSGSLTDEQLACFETTDGKNRLKSCGAKTTYTEPAGTLKAICSTGTNTTGACDPTAHPGGFSTIEIGHATDTTLGRTSAGVANIEGVNIALKPHTVQYAATPVIDDPDNFSTNFTGDNLYGGTFIANAAGTIALPNPAVGMNFTIVLEGANTVIIDPLGTGTADAIIMNGLAAAVDENITSSTSGAMCVFQYRSADRWMATCNGFVEATPP